MNDAAAIRRRLLANKDDLASGTFVHSLWEEHWFDESACEEMVRDFEHLAAHGAVDDQVTDLAAWLLDGVAVVFRSHHDPRDLATVREYRPSVEERWFSGWARRLTAACSMVGR